MGLFRKDRPGETVVAEPEPLVVESRSAKKKNAPTPSRKEAERARMERLHPTLSPKEQKAADRAAKDERRLAAQLAVERGPERTLLRNLIDSGWHMGEFSLPLLLLLIAATFATASWPNLTWVITIAMWVVLLLVALDIWLTWRRGKKLLRDRLGTTDFRTLFTYTMNRVIQIRRFRNPPPAIKRGDKSWM